MYVPYARATFRTKRRSKSICNVHFPLSWAVESHYTTRSIHTTCGHCGLRLRDKGELRRHVTLTHQPTVTVKCVPCGQNFETSVERKQHYQVSVNHPTCSVCGEGYADDAEIDNHLSWAHLDFRCKTCNEQFRSVDDLQSHYLSSSEHPHCASCEIGFADDQSCDKHMETDHPRPPPRMPSPLLRTPSPVIALVSHTRTVEPSSPETPPTSQPIQSSPIASAASTGTVADMEGTSTVETPLARPRPTPTMVEGTWRCRLCAMEPTAPTATICGHVFCTACIVQELVKTGSCPVCKEMILLHLHVEIA
ncbi:hypothetical protein K466DRAFT_552455 [Polyporus arcularius HHB13444]|uniref:RING-type domain-containing protein n=1 Tax=Polyporus arcularius HHB13444 TaxID=1314778 RepID=A0A5C3P8I7_9APHY|nr:hypothetical protein K466DRAFT_552455 [Polyporus arcularius HHB13444]